MKNHIAVVAILLSLLLAPLASFAKGPTGIGKLEIGMPRTAVESLSASDGVYLSTPMTPYEYKYSSPTSGVDKFDSLLVSPLSTTPLKAVLTFSGEGLKSIYVDLGDSLRVLDAARELITSKYGDPKTADSMKEEQCVYKGGANFKVKSGAIRYEWIQERAKAEPVSTRLANTVIDTCPSNLRYAIGAIKSRSLNIGIAEPEKKAVNPF